jgi:hypothetical protein
MTAGTNTGDGTSCYQCSHRTRLGDRVPGEATGSQQPFNKVAISEIIVSAR